MVITKAVGREKLGNPIWCAPEIMKGEEYSEKADVYSLGILFSEIASRIIPFSDLDVYRSKFFYAMEDAIIKGLRPTIPDSTPSTFATIIQSCWAPDPEQRPTMQEVFFILFEVLKNEDLRVSVPGSRIKSSSQHESVLVLPFRPLVEFAAEQGKKKTK